MDEIQITVLDWWNREHPDKEAYAVIDADASSPVPGVLFSLVSGINLLVPVMGVNASTTPLRVLEGIIRYGREFNGDAV